MKGYLHIFFLGGLLLLAPGCEPDTSDSPEPEDVFVKFYGSDQSEIAEDILVLNADTVGNTSNVRFVLFGTSNSFLIKSEANVTIDHGINHRVFYLVFTDNRGNPQSIRAFDVVPDRTNKEFVTDLTATDIIETSDDGFLIAGNATVEVLVNGQEEEVNRGVLIKLTSTGDLDGSWATNPVLTTSDALTNAFIDANPNDPTESGLQVPKDEVIESIIETSDGNLVLIGTTNNVTIKPDFNRQTDVTDIWVRKFGPDGYANRIFEQRIGFPTADRGKAIFERADGSLSIIASGPGDDDLSGTRDVLFITSDADLFSDNFQEFSDPDGTDLVIEDAELLSSGSIIVTGSKNGGTPSTFLLSINLNGSEDFFQTIDFDGYSNQNGASVAGFNHRGLGVTQTINGNLAVIGTLSAFIPSGGIAGETGVQKGDEILFFITNSFGQLPAADDNPVIRTFGGNDDDSGGELLQLLNGRFMLLGTVDFEGNSTMFSLMKTSSRGNLIR